ncbi:hypothetical protein [Asaia bogorensis]|uniref:hypothetical protein n=1 Tax=Asaia bogorensis TaxID=91915 RepID=UPI0030158EB8
MSLVNVTTVPERIVKDARGNKVPAQFSVNPDDPFWARLMAAGDIVEIKTDASNRTREPASTTASVTPSVTPSAALSTGTTASNKEATK